MDLKELRQLTGPELVEKAQQLTQELFNLIFRWGLDGWKTPCSCERRSGPLHGSRRFNASSCRPMQFLLLRKGPEDGRVSK